MQMDTEWMIDSFVWHYNEFDSFYNRNGAKRVHMMDRRYLLIQLIGFAGTALFFLSFQCKSNKNLFKVQFVSYLFYTIHMLLLGATTGGISYVINPFRSFWLGSKWEFAKGKLMCVIICMLQILELTEFR